MALTSQASWRGCWEWSMFCGEEGEFNCGRGGLERAEGPLKQTPGGQWDLTGTELG